MKTDLKEKKTSVQKFKNFNIWDWKWETKEYLEVD